MVHCEWKTLVVCAAFDLHTVRPLNVSSRKPSSEASDGYMRQMMRPLHHLHLVMLSNVMCGAS